jgi:alkylhydroperoxidase family enzyme
MARIKGAPAGWRKPMLALIYRMTRNYIDELTETHTENGIEPEEVHGHLPSVLLTYGLYVKATEKQHHMEERLKRLATTKAATLVQCEYCMDVTSSMARRSGLSDAQLLALPNYRDSEEFSEVEKLVLDYAVGVTRTPVAVSDELFAALREHFDERQMVELTNVLGVQNLHARFISALGIHAPGFSEGKVCVVPAQAQASAQEQVPAQTPNRERITAPVAS